MPYFQEVTGLLQDLIRIPSFSREEENTAACIRTFLDQYGVATTCVGNNVVARYGHFSKKRPTLLLVSHHDTVRPNPGYTRDPFEPAIENGRLYGLGSNDAGGPLVALIAAFLHFREQTAAAYNLVLVAAAEEEISGKGGIEACLPTLGAAAGAIVGEPTSLKMATAERGLLVVDALSTGSAGHAARNEGVNALYLALPDLEWIRQYHFPKVSEWLGPVGMQVTVIQAGSQHNVVPAECRFTIDIRLNEWYTHEEVLEILRKHLRSSIQPRSTRLRATAIAADHPLVRSGERLGLVSYGSPTLSDKALLPCPALKIGPGDSARSHAADEYLGLDELEAGILTYIRLLEPLMKNSSL
jgi:acetylornithine deacetylase